MRERPDSEAGDGTADGCVHMLSFDVEEYFQVEAAAARVSADDWTRYESRIRPCVERILELLNGHRTQATFFVLGWVARRCGELVRAIADQGHEIASHGMTHRMLQRIGPEGLRAELRDSRRLLEDLSGRPVGGFRAPTFSLTRRTAWGIDVLADCGYSYDSSVYPVRHDRYGVPGAPRWAHWAVGPSGRAMIELPPLTTRVLRTNVPMGGGGYLRLLPARLVGRAVSAACRKGHPAMIYLHPWELDPGQPVLPMGRLSRWRHRVNLARTERKLTWLLRRFAFGTAGSVAAGLRRQSLPRFSYG